MIETRIVADSVWALIDGAHASLNTYRNEILDAAGAATDPPLDPDGRVHPYAVAYLGAGQPTADRATPTPVRTPVTFQVSCVGGDDTRALWAADKIQAALCGQAVAGGRIVQISPPGQVRRDDNITPSRTVADLIFRIHTRG